ncbi:conserved hypothetical protein [Rhodospirillaceae bacterium LM-1]|nr:conserved hypothetical protein [Rhodospirillaceae bacterium LM-1]
MTIYSDIHAARLAHVGWEMELERLASGDQTSQALIMHTGCALGRWIRERGQDKYEFYKETINLLDAHENFHAVADEIIALNERCKADIPSDLILKMRMVSREVVYLLSSLELSVRLEKQKSEPLTHAIHSLTVLLGGSFGGGPFPMAPKPRMLDWIRINFFHRRSSTAIIDITAVRLNHLFWARDLELMLGSLGKIALHRNIPDADECDLSSWFSNVARQDIGNRAMFELLDVTHKEFHRQGIKAYSALRRQNRQEAHEAIEEVLGLSRDLVLALTHAEFRLSGFRERAIDA